MLLLLKLDVVGHFEVISIGTNTTFGPAKLAVNPFMAFIFAA